MRQDTYSGEGRFEIKHTHRLPGRDSCPKQGDFSISLSVLVGGTLGVLSKNGISDDSTTEIGTSSASTRTTFKIESSETHLDFGVRARFLFPRDGTKPSQADPTQPRRSKGGDEGRDDKKERTRILPQRESDPYIRMAFIGAQRGQRMVGTPNSTGESKGASEKRYTEKRESVTHN